MAVIYRAIWNDDRPGLAAVALEALRGWAEWKSDDGLKIPDEGHETGRSRSRDRDRGPDGRPSMTVHPATARVERASMEGGGEVLRASFVELRPDGSRWATTVRAWEHPEPDRDSPDGPGWLWIDVDAGTDDGLGRLTAVAPRLAADLVRSGAGPRRRCVALSTDPAGYAGEDGAEELAEILTHPDRDMPVAVFALDAAGPRAAGQRAAARAAAAQNVGVAAVCTIDESASRAMQSILGREFAVWGGAFRVYLPGLDPARARDDWRHRYVSAAEYARHQMTASRLIGKSVGPAAAARRAPRTYEAARAALDAAHTRDVDEWRELAEITEQQAAEQRDALSAAENRYVDLLGDHEDLLVDSAALRDRLAKAERELDRALRAMTAAGADTGFWDAPAGEDVAEPVPATAANCSEAAAQAQLYLSDRLSLPDSACVDLEDLDSTVESRAWGQTSWEALRALHAYAEVKAAGSYDGSFWTWCETSGHPLAWRATPKKLAMSESESVRQDERLWAHRLLPVDSAVDESGLMHMQAHIKVAEGGGPLAPRIYFLHADGKMHVGLFGPHRAMPNTKT